ncbi:MAG: biotin/lipoyl-containing protein [Burkholderiaceae bacterium]
MSNDPRGRRLALTDRELLDVIREFRATDWNAITLVHDELEIRIAKRRPGDPVRWDEPTASVVQHTAPVSAASSSEAAPATPTLSSVAISSGAPKPTPSDAGPLPDANPRPDFDSRASRGGTGEAAVVEAATVGTFWVAPAPGADPFVQCGDTVEAGQQLAIVEVMKLMTEVVAEQAGTIDAVLAENGQSVEAGQPLFRLRVSAPKAGA